MIVAPATSHVKTALQLDTLTKVSIQSLYSLHNTCRPYTPMLYTPYVYVFMSSFGFTDQFLSRFSTLTRDIDRKYVLPSVCPLRSGIG